MRPTNQILAALMLITVSIVPDQVACGAGICYSGYVRYQWYDAEDHTLRSETSYSVCGSRPPCEPLITIIPPEDREKFFFSFDPAELQESLQLDAEESLSFGVYFRNIGFENADDFQVVTMRWNANLGVIYGFPYVVYIDGLPSPNDAGPYRGAVAAYTENFTPGTEEFHWGFEATVRRISPYRLDVKASSGEVWSSPAKIVCIDLKSASLMVNLPFIVSALNQGRVVIANTDTFNSVMSAQGLTTNDIDEYTVVDPVGIGVSAFAVEFLVIGSGRLINGGGAPGDWSFDWLESGHLSDQHPIATYRDLARSFNVLASDCNSNGIWDTCDLDCGAIDTSCNIQNCGQSFDCNTNAIPDECEPPTDCQGNGVQDICDIALATSSDCNDNGVPDECELPTHDCNGNHIVDACDIAAGTGADCNGNLVPDACEVIFGSSADCDGDAIPDECEPDCNSNGIHDICDITNGAADCNANDIPDECESLADCQPNGIQDICDLESGSFDCNANAVPDECEPDCNGDSIPDDCDILVGYSDDCDRNGIPDECDIAAGSANDCQPNGIPDHCEKARPAYFAEGQDACADAEIACPGIEYTGSTVVATNDGSATCADSATTADAWYRYTPVADGSVTVSLVGSEYDNALSVHSSCPGSPANELVCNDDWCGTQAKLTFSAEANHTYWIRISGWNGSTGVYRMMIDGPACPIDVDCDDDLIPDECELSSGAADDCDLNGVPDNCEPDCNENAVADACDLSGGTSLDCNSNGVPDECELYPHGDCNNNGVVDACDIAAGSSADADGNGKPDECEFNCLAEELQKLAASDSASGDSFGISVAVSGNRVISGADGYDGNGNSSGAAYIHAYSGGTWIEKALLTASDGGSGDHFGYSVALDDDVAVVGAYGDDDRGGEAGAAYVYHRDGEDWFEEAKLTASDGGAGDQFGYSVAVDDGVIVIGAYGDDDNGNSAGAAYVFRYNGGTWVEEAKLTALDGVASDLLGFSVGVSGDVIVLGAYGDDDLGSASGAAYVYRYDTSTWVEEAKLRASDGAAGRLFGAAVTVAGSVIAVGAYGDNQNGNESGSAYVFRDSNGVWGQEVKLVASDASAGADFGYAVAASHDVVLVGALAAGGRGAAYSYRRQTSVPGGWVEESKLVAGDGASGDYFGFAVAISGDVAACGAYRNDGNGANAGSTYVFRGISVDCNGNGANDLCDITVGSAADVDSNGIVDDCDSDCDFDGVPDQCAVNCAAFPGFCELIAECGTANDCNGNGLPDSCDIAGATSTDCNGNIVPDTCEIVAGSAADCNTNSIPDVCERLTLGVPALLICSRDGDSVTAFDVSTGQRLGYLAVPGVGGLDYANGIAMDAHGDFYVASVRTQSVLHVSGATGAVLRELSAPGLLAPAGVFLLPSERLLVSGYVSDNVVEFNLNTGLPFGDFIAPGYGGLNGPTAITWSNSNTVLISSQLGNQVLEYTLAGDFIRIAADGVGVPAGIVVTEENVLLVASFTGDSVERYDLDDGSYLGAHIAGGTGGLDGAEGLVRAPSGNLLVTSRETNSILEFASADGSFVRILVSDARLQQPNYFIFAPFLTDCNGTGTLDVCELSGDDCNTNAVPDECELLDNNCNSNAFPDECDLALGDCNTNGVPDSCDADWDADGHPDECDGDIDGDGFANEIDACVYSPPGDPVNPFGGPMGDIDDDCAVTLDDYYFFEICLYLSGPGEHPGFQDCLDVFDFDNDTDVDLLDFASFSELFGN
jgi:hypothetical protein